MPSKYIFTLHGTRGSYPVADARYNRYGGKTTCFSLKTPSELLIFDAGTGIVDAAAFSTPNLALPVTIFFTHFHLDHIMGLPTYPILYKPEAKITLRASSKDYPQWRMILNQLVSPPYWPLRLDRCGAEIQTEDLPGTGILKFREVEVSWLPVRHTQPCLAYRLKTAGFSLVIATDYEPGDAGVDAEFISFAEGADIMLFDAQFTPTEYPNHQGWGHGTWEQGVALAQAASISKLLLTHHSPRRSDSQADALLEQARRAFAQLEMARDGMKIELSG